jgi:protein PhnA
MNLERSLINRGQNRCELCASDRDLVIFALRTPATAETAALLCGTCRGQASGGVPLDEHHWRCLAESIWSEHLPVKILSARLLGRLSAHAWARELRDQLILDDEDRAFADEGPSEDGPDGAEAPTLDANGTALADGDAVTLVKDLDVKGAGFTAKRGTLVKNIKLTGNPKHVEGRVNGIQIVLVAGFLKKS